MVPEQPGATKGLFEHSNTIKTVLKTMKLAVAEKLCRSEDRWEWNEDRCGPGTRHMEPVD